MPSGSTDNPFDAIEGAGVALSEMFVNLSAEYPDLLDAIFITFGAIGALVACSAVIDLIKLGQRDAQNGGTGSIFAKLVGGSLMIDLAFWGKVFTDTLWSYSDPLGIESYAAGGGDMAQTALMAVIGFIVLAGYVVLGRAYYMVTKIGYLSPDARSDLIGNILSRVVAGSAMIACLHIAKAIEESTGLNWIPT